MHVPDGFLDLPTSAVTGAAAVAAVGVALRRSAGELRDAGAARAGLTGCFVFAAQMVNFPVGAGTSGHLIGAGLAAALVGPWTAVVTMACVLLVQALVFADGGVTALGTNIVLVAVVPVLVATAVSRGLLALARHRRTLVAPAAGVGAFVSVPAAALAFTGLYAAGGRVEVPLALLAAAMTGTHLLIGIGEGLVTAAVIAAVLAARPDLVHLWQASAPAPVLAVVDGQGRTSYVPADRTDPGPSVRGSGAGPGLGRPGVLVGVGAAVVVASGLSLFASAAPDGLESVAARLGFATTAAEPLAAGSPLADYALPGGGTWGTSLAGLAGVALTLGLTLLAAGLAARLRADRTSPAPAPAPLGRTDGDDGPTEHGRGR